MKVGDLKELIEKGEYRVDPTTVADAILQRLRKGAAARAEGIHSEKECSYPDGSSFPSRKTTPLVPSTTEPIQVRPMPFRRLVGGMVSTVLQHSPGTHAHSS